MELVIKYAHFMHPTFKTERNTQNISHMKLNGEEGIQDMM